MDEQMQNMACNNANIVEEETSSTVMSIPTREYFRQMMAWILFSLIGIFCLEFVLSFIHLLLLMNTTGWQSIPWIVTLIKYSPVFATIIIVILLSYLHRKCVRTIMRAHEHSNILDDSIMSYGKHCCGAVKHILLLSATVYIAYTVVDNVMHIPIPEIVRILYFAAAIVILSYRLTTKLPGNTNDVESNCGASNDQTTHSTNVSVLRFWETYKFLVLIAVVILLISILIYIAMMVLPFWLLNIKIITDLIQYYIPLFCTSPRLLGMSVVCVLAVCIPILQFMHYRRFVISNAYTSIRRVFNSKKIVTIAGIVILLFSCRQNFVNKMLLGMTQGQQHRQVMLLLSQGADINTKDSGSSQTPLMLAAYNDEPGLCSLFLRMYKADVNALTNDKVSALTFAMHGGIETVKLLLQHGANVNNVNSIGITPLYAALYVNDESKVKLLIAYGADINHHSVADITPMLLCLKGDRLQILRILIRCGAKLDYIDVAGFSLLHYAAKLGNIAIVKLLVDNGICLNQTDFYGNTALHIAARYGYANIVCYLLAKHAHVNAVNSIGETPLNIAIQYHHINIQGILLMHGGRPYSEISIPQSTDGLLHGDERRVLRQWPACVEGIREGHDVLSL